MMLAAALLTGGSAFAQTTTDGTTGATTQVEKGKKGESCDANCKKGDKKKGPKGDKKKNGPRAKFNPFDGIQLTADQQQKLEVLQRGLGPVELSKTQQEKIPVNPNLTKEQKKQLKQERKAKKLEAKKKYLAGVKETLTPDQYVIFLENFYLYAPQKQKDKKSSFKGRPGIGKPAKAVKIKRDSI